MINEIKVSVIIPVYNVEDYLEETIESILNQTLGDIEILLIDDGSTDSSPSIIQRYAEKHPNIVFLKQQNEGPGQARNRGLDHARGEFISFVDSDDLLPTEALEIMYNAAVNEHADVVTGKSISFNSEKTWYIQNHVKRGVYNPGLKKLEKNPELLYSLGPCNKMFRKSLVENVRFPAGIKVTEDHPFIIEAYLKATRMVTVDEIIYRYRRRENENNLSLSQIVRVEAGNVIRDICRSLKVSDPLWGKYLLQRRVKNELKFYYYNRILFADIKPAVVRAIKKKDIVGILTATTVLIKWAIAYGKKVLA